MGKYLKKFQTTSQYNAYTADTANFILPNVSLTVDNDTVHYNPSTPPTPVETRLVAKYNVYDTSSPTQIIGEESTSYFSSIEIDGVEQAEITTAYTFSTIGEHTVKYTLADPTSIGNGAFSPCGSITSIDIPNGVTSIDDYAFDSCSSLSSVTIPNSVTSIGWGSFNYCSGLTNINIPNSVISIDYYAFCGCESLDATTVATIEEISEYAFYCD